MAVSAARARHGSLPDPGEPGRHGTPTGRGMERSHDSRHEGSRDPRPSVDPDFAQEVLEDLYAYRRKRLDVAWVLWLLFGWAGGHRFYLERPGTGILMLLTGGGLLIWWLVDARRLRRMVRYHNVQQQRRERDGRPPLELSFMPPLADDVLSDPPAWTAKWAARPRWRRRLRFTGDLIVLMVAGAALGALADTDGGMEGVFAITALIAVILLGGAAGWLDRVPLAGAFLRWSHRLRLFYYYNRPGPPPALLVRSLTGPILAVFRRRAREETRLYLEVGAVFALGFLAIDVVENVAAPLTGDVGLTALVPMRLLGIWLQEVFMTFFVIYAFATPIGAVLTLHLLTRPTHTVPRLMGGFALLFIALGAGWI